MRGTEPEGPGPSRCAPPAAGLATPTALHEAPPRTHCTLLWESLGVSCPRNLSLSPGSFHLPTHHPGTWAQTGDNRLCRRRSLCCTLCAEVSPGSRGTASVATLAWARQGRGRCTQKGQHSCPTWPWGRGPFPLTAPMEQGSEGTRSSAGLQAGARNLGAGHSHAGRCVCSGQGHTGVS